MWLGANDGGQAHAMVLESIRVRTIHSNAKICFPGWEMIPLRQTIPMQGVTGRPCQNEGQ